MFGTHFYHEKTRRAVAIFGKLFNNLYVIRKNSAGAATSQVKVPLAYAPKAKYLDRIRENPNLDTNTKVAIKLPRMSFEITSLVYDNQRQVAKTNNFTRFGTSDNNRNKFFTGTPYVISFQLNIYTKTQDDALQIVEQILPTFNPQYSITLKPFSDHPDILEDIPIAINGVSFQDDFEGDLGARRTIIYTLDFSMHIRYYPALTEGEIVRDVRAKVFDIGAGLADSDIRLNTIQILPKPTTLNILADSDFGFTRIDYGADSDAS
tara:strand:- start:1948 stop:2739 length:792 start_codon:yes stop_codon:yes gene_type:complete